jgi:hypothetical protein
MKLEKTLSGTPCLTEAQMLKRVRNAIREHADSQKAAAETWEISPQHVCDVLKKRRLVGASIAAQFGMVPVTVYVPRELLVIANGKDE